MKLELDQLNYNPKNSLSAVFFFLFGSFLVWWSYDKIAVFNSVFENNLPKILIWATFLMMYVSWLVIVPLLCLTGKSIGVREFLSTFYYGFMGLLIIIVGLPISQVIITALENIFQNVIITSLSWIVVLIGVIYISLIKPYEALW